MLFAKMVFSLAVLVRPKCIGWTTPNSTRVPPTQITDVWWRAPIASRKKLRQKGYVPNACQLEPDCGVAEATRQSTGHGVGMNGADSSS
jgi:hypothetical protein